ncbi:MAG TPA: hypothetical protein VHU22_00755 [Xanthobacteraceae bacterium]|jgi:hypothetical protein|nr:hypothetical protein [Xanthobacteraceae bacterium]
MPEPDLGARPARRVDTAIVIEPRDLVSAREALMRAEATGELAEFERDQLARDIADIENATAALRRAEPALQSWTKPQAPVVPKLRPLWLLMGLVWLSTAILTVGAAYAIAALYG